MKIFKKKDFFQMKQYFIIAFWTIIESDNKKREKLLFSMQYYVESISGINFTCWANSLVGASIRAWHSLRLVSTFCRIAIENVAVFPVPDWAWAITSKPKKENNFTK